MGLFGDSAKFLFYSKSIGASFEDTLTLGRLSLYATKDEIREHIARFKNNAKSIDDVKFTTDYSEPLFEILGASSIESVDYSDYEQATIIHDLNKPFPESMKNRFSVVVDGGTIEHVFNFPVAIRNCMESLKPGGHYIGITPANNQMGHGFYQFSPELFYRIFSAEAGFAVKKIFLVTTNSDDGFSDWYEVADPLKVKSRVELTNSKPVTIMVLAQKISNVPLENFIPQQSDYASRWAIEESLKEGQVPEGESKLKYLYRRYTPVWTKKAIHKTRSLFRKRKAVNTDLGVIDSEHFKKVIFEEQRNPNL